jgi:cation:H+ antiporter
MPVLLDIFLFAASLALTLAAASFFARRLDRVGLHLGLPEALLGLLTALAADAPETSSALVALIKGKHDVGVGVILGSNVFNLAAMIGLSAVLCGRIRIRRKALTVEGAVGIAATVVVGALLLELIPAWLALVLLAVVIVPYLAVLSRVGERHRPDHVLAHGEALLVPALTLVPALALIVAGSTGMVESAVSLAHRWSVPDAVVGIFVLAILTSLPNAFTAARLAFQQRGSAVVSETMNSNTTNLVFGISVPALFVSLGSTAALTQFELGWLLLMTLAAIALLGRRGGVTRSGGLAILLLYAVFVAVELIAVT